MNLNERKSLVLVTVDCLRADHAGFMGYMRPTTPFLDGLARESLVFPKAVVTGVPTYYSFPGLMASRFPLALGRDVIGIAPGEPTLATVLEQAGCRTAAFVAANPYLSARFGYAQGFQVFRELLAEDAQRPDGGGERPEPTPRTRTRLNEQVAELAHKFGPIGTLYDELYFQYCQRIAAPGNESWDRLRRYPSADVLVGESCDWLASLSGAPFFLWLHLMDPHAPYCPPAEALKAMALAHLRPQRGRYLNASWNRWDIGTWRLRAYRDEIVCLYDAGIRWVDLQMERLVEALRRFSLWDSCVFVLTADHGEEFLDHGGRFHPPSQAYQEMLRVPLLLRVPGVSRRPLADGPFSHIHVAPTILEALGIGVPEEFEGRSCWSGVQTGESWELAISESVSTCTSPWDCEKRLAGRALVVQDRRFKLVLDFDRDREELFDLGNDPHEMRALPREAEKKTRARLLRAAFDHLTRQPQGSKAELALRARVRQIGLEWSHSRIHAANQAV